eukprot:TRINITY_DN67131_c0_g1_i3.p2 TRINITY_DN67131_c0_g1~~TRINITY_DN67131_c0_g1_i3.p2  ORF type:complete len:215 (+),score=-17.66 TRINITY_DN67131_c0_g1_i3:802-1446(+)
MFFQISNFIFNFFIFQIFYFLHFQIFLLLISIVSQKFFLIFFNQNRFKKRKSNQQSHFSPCRRVRRVQYSSSEAFSVSHSADGNFLPNCKTGSHFSVVGVKCNSLVPFSINAFQQFLPRGPLHLNHSNRNSFEISSLAFPKTPIFHNIFLIENSVIDPNYNYSTLTGQFLPKENQPNNLRSKQLISRSEIHPFACGQIIDFAQRNSSFCLRPNH